jgi:hypothetical protein
MVEALDTFRGVPMGDVIHEGNGYVVQEIPEHSDGGVIAQDGENVIAFGTQHVEAALDSGEDQQYPGVSLVVLYEGDTVTLESESGSRIVLEEPESVLDAVRAAAE